MIDISIYNPINRGIEVILVDVGHVVHLAYSVMRVCMASSVISMLSAGTPVSFCDWGSRYRRAMAIFSLAMYPDILITYTASSISLGVCIDIS